MRIAEYFGLAPYLDAVVGIPLNEHHADKAALIARALPAGADKARVVMVGDRKFDVLGAKDAGVSSLAVGYGYGTREELDACAPDFFAETVDDLFPLLGVERPRGRFFTFEGNDGCGKSTQMALIGDWLAERGWEIVRTREPGGCPVAERIRALVLADAADREARAMTAECEAPCLPPAAPSTCTMSSFPRSKRARSSSATDFWILPSSIRAMGVNLARTLYVK